MSSAERADFSSISLQRTFQLSGTVAIVPFRPEPHTLDRTTSRDSLVVDSVTRRRGQPVVRQEGSRSGGQQDHAVRWLRAEGVGAAGGTVGGSAAHGGSGRVGSAADVAAECVPGDGATVSGVRLLRQTVGTNAAAVVAESSVKPASVYSVVRVQDKTDVVAHLAPRCG
jgi:hypothetical protein